MKRLRTAALLVAALVASMGTNAYAAPGDAPAGWTLIGSDTVRYFLPGSTPPAGADAADAATAATISSQNPASGEWLLVNTDNVKDFIPDGAESSSDQLISSTFVSSRSEQQTYSGGRQKLAGEPTYDPELRETDTKKWRLTSQTATIRRYDVPIYRNVHTPYRIVDRFGYETRTVDTYDNTYRANKIVKTALGQEVVDTHSYTKREEKATAWVRGDIVASLDKLVSTGVDDTTQTTYQQYVVDLLAGKVAESDKSQGTKNSTFLSDNGSGNSKTTLSGSQKRVAFKADNVVASEAKKAEDKGSIKDPSVGKDKDKDKAPDPAPTPIPTIGSNSVGGSAAALSAAANLVVVDPIDDVVGTWRLAGGSESYFTIERSGKENIKVHMVLKSQFGSFDHDWTTKYASSWSVTNKLGVTSSGQLSSDRKKIVITTKFLKSTVSSTFVKQ